MKVIKAIFNFIGFIFKLILVLILMLVILLVSKSVVNNIEYARYKETGIMKNGNLCISHMCRSPGYQDKYYNSDNSVLQEVKDFYEYEGVKLGIGNADGDVFGKVYKPINSGTSDIYVGYSTSGGEIMKYFEVYHVEVDKDLNITYSMETITKEQFEENLTYDIVFKGISSEDINYFIKEIFNIKQENIISSHFFSESSGDYEFSDDMDLNEYFSGSNTASIFSETITLNRTYNKAVCVITSDAESVDIDCSIPATDFDMSDIMELAEWLDNLYLGRIISYAEISSSAENTPLFKT